MWPRFRHVSPPCHLGGIEARGGGPHCWGMSMLAAALVVTIRVYDLYGLSPDTRQEALALAAEALAHAGVQAIIVDCSAGRRPPRRARRASPRARSSSASTVTRRTAPTCSATPSSAARPARTPSPPSTPRPSPNGPGAPARAWRRIVGRVSAHEIGHLLLGTNAHASHGLMRPSWELQRLDRGDWDFTIEDAADDPRAGCSRTTPRALLARADSVSARSRGVVTPSRPPRVDDVSPSRHLGSIEALRRGPHSRKHVDACCCRRRPHHHRPRLRPLRAAADQRAKALALAGETLAKANVVGDVDRLLPATSGRAPPPVCAAVLKQGDIVLRLQHRTSAGHHILGTAIVQDGGPNVLASVYAESVAERSAKTGLPRSVILGPRHRARDRPPAARHQRPRAGRPDARDLEPAAAAPERVAVHRRRRGQDPARPASPQRRRGRGRAALDE